MRSINDSTFTHRSISCQERFRFFLSHIIPFSPTMMIILCALHLLPCKKTHVRGPKVDNRSCESLRMCTPAEMHKHIVKQVVYLTHVWYGFFFISLKYGRKSWKAPLGKKFLHNWFEIFTKILKIGDIIQKLYFQKSQILNALNWYYHTALLHAIGNIPLFAIILWWSRV